MADGEDQAQKGTQLLEIYALEIQMYNETKNHKKLKASSLNLNLFLNSPSVQEIYNAANSVRSAIPHPRILGVIKECGGKMWMGERELAGLPLVSLLYHEDISALLHRQLGSCH